MTASVQIIEVGPRDGFQPIATFIPTETKILFVERLFAAGLVRIETTSFTNPKAIPQLSDALQVVKAGQAMNGLNAQVLVPSFKQMERAVAAQCTDFAAIVSVSDAHNKANVNRTTAESVLEYQRITKIMPPEGRMRLNVVTAFDCPFDGRVDRDHVQRVLDALLSISTDVEVALCDTTGRADPRQVGQLFDQLIEAFPDVPAWAFHGHDTYGMGAANVMAAYQSGVRLFDASIAGLGGCPFAPGATGNVATEDLVWMFGRMGVSTGVDLDALLSVAQDAALLDVGLSGGRVRKAYSASRCAA